MRTRMRCSKVKIVAAVLIFSMIVGMEMFFSYTKDDGQSLLSSAFRSEEKPSASWISGKTKPQSSTLNKSSVAFTFSVLFLFVLFFFVPFRVNGIFYHVLL